jgi:hypothetical protein
MAHSASHRRLSLFALAALLAGCHDNTLVPEPNRVPVARARVMGMEGSSVIVPSSGSAGPVSITLDGTTSTDPDGGKLTYRWLSGTSMGGSAPAAGSGGSGGSGPTGGREASSGKRWVPAGSDGAWPEDVERPMVSLPDGDYKFVLWVVDDKGAISDPDTLEISVGGTPIDPALQSCVDSVVPTVQQRCAACVCGVSDACKAAANMSVCGPDCWGLLNCIGTMCPDFMTNMSCVTTNCTSFLGGATGAQMIGGCVTMCAADCRAM